MIIDINTYVGHWPFRQIWNNTPEQLGARMDDAGIDIACVSNLNSIFYRDVQAGNEELYEQISLCKAYKDRLIPFAIINPAYPAWEKDFLHCIDDLGMKGLELYPCYHNYKLSDSAAAELIKMAAEKGIPVHLPCAIENRRQRHHLDVKEDITAESVKAVLALCPEADFIISNGPSGVIHEQLCSQIDLRKGKVFFDISRCNMIGSDFDDFVRSIGVDRVVFGSAMPFQYIDTQLVKLYFSRLSREEMDKIMYANLKELFKL